MDRISSAPPSASVSAPSGRMRRHPNQQSTRPRTAMPPTSSNSSRGTRIFRHSICLSLHRTYDGYIHTLPIPSPPGTPTHRDTRLHHGFSSSAMEMEMNAHSGTAMTRQSRSRLTPTCSVASSTNSMGTSNRGQFSRQWCIWMMSAL